MRKNIILAEMYGLQVMLLEGRMDFLKTKYAPLIAQNAPLVSEFMRMTGLTNLPDIGANVIDEVSSFDPDKVKKYTQWLLDMLLKRSIRLEDLPNAKRILSKFDKMKLALPIDQRDIRRFKTMAELSNVVDPLQPQQSQRSIDREYASEMFKQADVLLDTAQYRIVIPKTHEASCYFGTNTRWCTTLESPRYFNTYSRQGPLYIILDKKNNERWQFHFETAQYMDEQDRAIDPQEMCSDHPAIADFFKSIGRFFSISEMYQTVGNTDDFRKQLCTIIEEETRTCGFINDGANIVLSQAKNIDEFIEEHGDRTAKWISKVIEDGALEYYDSAHVEDENRSHFLHSLDNGTLLKLGELLKTEYADAIEENELEFDPTSVSDICELHHLVEHDELETAFKDAVETGMRYGAEKEMMDDLKSSIIDFGVLFKKGDTWSSELQWDTPVCFAPLVKDLISELAENKDAAAGCEIIDDYQKGIVVDDPRYGWNGWDEDAAVERFGELIQELI